MTCPRGFKVALMLVVLALAMASSASAGPFVYTSSVGFNQPGSPQVDLSGGGFLTPQNSPVNLTKVMVGTAFLSTGNGDTTDYSGMNAPIQLNISVVLKTSKGTGGIVIGGILTGLLTDLNDPFQTQDLTNLNYGLGFSGDNFGSVTIGNDLYELTINGFPFTPDFVIDPNNDNSTASAPIFGKIMVTQLSPDPVATPEPSTVVAMLIGGLVSGSYVRSRRRKATAA